jgi:rsbT co-antagonist protein RsbR
VVQQFESDILQQWMQQQLASVNAHSNLIKEPALREESRAFLALLRRATQDGNLSDFSRPEWADVRRFLGDLSASRAQQGFTPNETATFIFSLKQPLFQYLRLQADGNADSASGDVWQTTLMLDQLGLFTMEAYQQNREQIILRQQQELLELSTPVVRLWEGILALPLIGTLDSARTQVVMENLLQYIVETGADIAIIDITGVPTVDTLVAQHLLKTVAAARLMGAECFISGIRPQIAQTIVHLGIDLNSVVTKASLAAAFAVALQRRGLSILPATQVADA